MGFKKQQPYKTERECFWRVRQCKEKVRNYPCLAENKQQQTVAMFNKRHRLWASKSSPVEYLPSTLLLWLKLSKLFSYV